MDSLAMHGVAGAGSLYYYCTYMRVFMKKTQHTFVF